MEQDSPYPVLNHFITAGGTIDVGRIDTFDCAAVASNATTVWVLLIRREGETLHDLLSRLNEALAGCLDTGLPVAEPAVALN